ncbi:ABC transporter ATP-binding protein [Gracilibacillus phocaeensis]|uniref:ABC transporter ATP-binding protein n=1 Tax=Gracilibacillus phocaeensis TaxID=2042304 RepID=UPI00102F7A12|nr:ABC transporter ATP-binding protein [Gracilibacillus phocaeensis]
MEIVQNESNSIIEVSDLSVEFRTGNRNIKAVNNISFSLKQSETLAILGESGSGKSTAALAILGLLPKSIAKISNGKIIYKNQDLLQLPEAKKRKLYGTQLSIIFQDPLSALNPVLTIGYQIGEALRFHQKLKKKDVKKKVIELMEQVKIPDAANRINNYPHQFSGGMQQRVMIAMALALNPDVLIADEPTTALDVTVQAQIMNLLKELQQKYKMGLILISHDLGVVAEYANQVAVMYAGRIVEQGQVNEVFTKPTHPYTIGLMKSIPKINNKNERLTPIKGSPPNFYKLSKGCSFYDRCRFAKEKCKQETPVLREVMKDRKSACHFAEEVMNK